MEDPVSIVTLIGESANISPHVHMVTKRAKLGKI
jgi:hypothetical protein